MWKTLVATGFSAVLIGAASAVELSQAVAETGPETIAQFSFNQVDLVCYMQTSDGRTINLTSLCGSRPLPSPAPATASAADSAPLSPNTNLGNLDIYGRGRNAPPCFGLDDQGQPCPTSQ